MATTFRVWPGEEAGLKLHMSMVKLKWGPTMKAGKPNPSQGTREQPGARGMDTADCPRHVHHPAPSPCSAAGRRSPLSTCWLLLDRWRFWLVGSRMSISHSQNLSKACNAFVLGFQLAALFSNTSPGVGKLPYRTIPWKVFWKTFIIINNYSNLLSAFLYSYKAPKIFPIDL